MHNRKQFGKFTELSKYTMVEMKINSKLHQALQQGNIPPLAITELETKPLTESWIKPQGTWTCFSSWTHEQLPRMQGKGANYWLSVDTINEMTVPNRIMKQFVV